ncbi:hypothetical protein H310_13461 [Aphanomyces invadans]|uniref:Golgin subfamily A member 7/ERF4 domain-containing protein n=1 Tax=Aphanomyces invadans TaxID=157072 RepID=A0A024TDU9_9STRA|nr:hypothetical protein H310_13461 [Aphanomyces invadans]ETV92228.1 hypothetical protein H310_13461 [Aphanomyces invadans]|eukprot:XP_008879192.1 hypothetical protein H310_13461 [Aphanomyces invadans]
MQPTMTAARKDRSRVFLMPQRMPFISGITNRYDDDFPIELDGLVTEAQFSQAINQINNTLTDYWPCLFCVCCGYLCCVCTAGLSLLCPNMCISDAEQYTRTLIERINARPCFKDADVEWKLVKKCCRSWIEISLPIVRPSLCINYRDDQRNVEIRYARSCRGRISNSPGRCTAATCRHICRRHTLRKRRRHCVKRPRSFPSARRFKCCLLSSHTCSSVLLS